MPENKLPLPPLDFNGGGTCPTYQYRARPTWWGGCVIEELWASRDGTKRWERIRWPVSICINVRGEA